MLDRQLLCSDHHYGREVSVAVFHTVHAYAWASSTIGRRSDGVAAVSKELYKTNVYWFLLQSDCSSMLLVASFAIYPNVLYIDILPFTCR